MTCSTTSFIYHFALRDGDVIPSVFDQLLTTPDLVALLGILLAARIGHAQVVATQPPAPLLDLPMHDGLKRAVRFEFIRPMGTVSDDLANKPLLDLGGRQALEFAGGQGRRRSAEDRDADPYVGARDPLPTASVSGRCRWRHASRYDVIKTIESALEPHRPRDFTIPGLVYGSHDGFPSQRLPELAYTTWEWIKLDNAKANLAKETLDALCEFVGCCADAGPKYSPDDRPYIERFFGTIASRLSSRLPGYTGSHPRDLRRALADPKGKLRLFVSFDELEELVEYAIASYNGTPHASLNNVTPLEAMEYFIRGKEQLVTWLPEHRRRTLCLMQSARRRSVRAYRDRGIRPHINLYGVRYTSNILACSTDLIGKSLLIYMNADDLRCVRAFQPDGVELGLLEAQGSWGVMRHNLKLRQQIDKERKDKKRPRGEVEADPIADYVDGKMGQAKKTRKAAQRAHDPVAQTPSDQFVEFFDGRRGDAIVASDQGVRLALRIREAAARAGSGTVLLFCDEAQRYNDNKYAYFEFQVGGIVADFR